MTSARSLFIAKFHPLGNCKHISCAEPERRIKRLCWPTAGSSRNAESLHVCRIIEILRLSLKEFAMTRRLDRFLERTHIAYFSMEIAIRPEMHTYSGGLGVLSGDTVRSCADLEIPIVFVTLVSHAGCFRQVIDPTTARSSSRTGGIPEILLAAWRHGGTADRATADLGTALALRPHQPART